jgi:hypothetical protein
MSDDGNKREAVSTTDEPPSEKSDWTKDQLADAKSVKESFDSLNAFCGLMAGFEAFIINDYVNAGGLSDQVFFNAAGTDVYEDEFSEEFKFGLFILIISFCCNLAAAMASFLWGVYLREGMYREVNFGRRNACHLNYFLSLHTHIYTHAHIH